MFHGYNNCMNCVMRKYDGNRLDIDDFHVLRYVPVHEFMEGTRLEELPHIEVQPKVAATVQVGNTEIQMLRQADDPGPIQFEDTGVLAEVEIIAEDHLRAAYLPTVHRPIITYDGVEITRDDFIRKYSVNGQCSMSAIPEEDRRRIRFPSRACNVLTVTMIDRRSLHWMAQAKSVTGLTATITPLQQAFLGEILVGLKQCTIAPKDDRKMDKIIVVGMRREIPVKMYIDRHWIFQKMFRYRETQKAAERDFEALKNSGIPIRLGFDKHKYMLSSDEHEYGQHKILQTYSFGSLGRGIDFGEYDLVDVNASIYKPIGAYVTNDPESLRDLIMQDRANTITQNVGRILRRAKESKPALKTIILEGLDAEEELSAIAGQLASMSHNGVECWWVPEFLATEEVCEWLSVIDRDKVLPADVPRGFRDLIEQARVLVHEGHSKKAIKLKLRWSTVRRMLTPDEVQQVETDVDQMLEARDPNVRRQKLYTTDKITKLRSRRLTVIRRLKATGRTDGQVRNDMKVPRWARSEREWFEAVLKDQERSPECQVVVA
jgi:hypothetical protein